MGLTVHALFFFFFFLVLCLEFVVHLKWKILAGDVAQGDVCKAWVGSLA
jgi:hypothetical protein